MSEGGDGGEKVPRLRPRRVDVNLEFDSLAQMTQYVSNISRSGCFLRSRDPWPVGTRLNLRFTVVAEDPEVLEAVGEVVRVSERPRGMGLKFVQLPVPARKVIDGLLARKPRRRK
jgi:uncharacterized protein (TIGR02266 family)